MVTACGSFANGSSSFATQVNLFPGNSAEFVFETDWNPGFDDDGKAYTITFRNKPYLFNDSFFKRFGVNCLGNNSIQLFIEFNEDDYKKQNSVCKFLLNTGIKLDEIDMSLGFYQTVELDQVQLLYKILKDYNLFSDISSHSLSLLSSIIEEGNWQIYTENLKTHKRQKE